MCGALLIKRLIGGSRYKACTDHEPCAQALDRADSHIPAVPPQFFKELIGCFQASAVGSTRRLAQQQHRDELQRVVSEVKCDACTFVVEGCTNSLATNYLSAAVADDGSCVVMGCTKSSNRPTMAT